MVDFNVGIILEVRFWIQRLLLRSREKNLMHFQPREILLIVRRKAIQPHLRPVCHKTKTLRHIFSKKMFSLRETKMKTMMKHLGVNWSCLLLLTCSWEEEQEESTITMETSGRKQCSNNENNEMRVVCLCFFVFVIVQMGATWSFPSATYRINLYYVYVWPVCRLTSKNRYFSFVPGLTTTDRIRIR